MEPRYFSSGHTLHAALKRLDERGEPYQVRVHTTTLTARQDDAAPPSLDVLSHNPACLVARMPEAVYQKFYVNLDLCPVVEIIEL